MQAAGLAFALALPMLIGVALLEWLAARAHPTTCYTSRPVGLLEPR
mgnify:CR=1 FL=1